MVTIVTIQHHKDVRNFVIKHYMIITQLTNLQGDSQLTLPWLAQGQGWNYCGNKNYRVRLTHSSLNYYQCQYLQIVQKLYFHSEHDVYNLTAWHTAQIQYSFVSSKCKQDFTRCLLTILPGQPQNRDLLVSLSAKQFPRLYPGLSFIL